MAIELGAAYISVLPSTSKLAGAVRKELDTVERDSKQRTKRIGAGLKSALLVGAGGAAGIGLALKTVTGNASDLNESLNAVNVTFGKQAAGVKLLGEQAARSLGLSNTQFNELAVRFSSFAKTIGGGGKATVSTLDDMTTRASDFASVMNLEVNEAAAIFQSGLAGESEPLRRFGIDLSAAAVQSFAYAKGIAKSGKTLTENEKVQARYGLLMKQTSKAQGDFENTSGDVANQGRILKSVFTDVTAKVGAGLLPVMQNVGAFLLDKAIPAVESFVAQWQDSAGVAGVARRVLESLTGALRSGFDFVVRWRDVLIPAGVALLAVVGAMKAWAGVTKVATAVTKGFAAVQAALNIVMAANPIGVVALALVGLVAGLTVAYRRSATFRRIVDAAWSGIKQAVSVAWNRVLKPAFEGIVAGLKKAGSFFSWLWDKAVKPAWTGITAIFRVAWAYVSTVFKGWMKAVKLAGTVVKFLFEAFVAPAFEGIWTVIKWAWGKVKPVFDLWWKGVKTLGSIASWLWKRAIRPAFEGIGAVIRVAWRNVIKPVFDTLKRWVTETIPGGFRRGMDKVASIWGSLQRLAATPVNFLIGTVYNNGIRKLFNALPLGRDLPRIPLVSWGNNSGGSESRIRVPGGTLLSFASGGRVTGPGTETSDSILARLSTNEFVVRASAARKYARLLDFINGGGQLPGFASGGRVWPLRNGVASTYPGHDGVDLNAPNDHGKPYLSAADGTVSYVGWGRGYGNAVFVRGPYGELVYGHSSRTYARAGQPVAAGQILGLVGNTGNSSGPHLHFGFPGGTYEQAMAFLRGSNKSFGSARTGGFDWNPARILSIAKGIASGIRDLGGSEIGRMLRASMGATMRQVRTWINDKVPGPGGPIPGGIFDSGGVLEPGAVAVNTSKRPEAVFTHDQFRAFMDGSSRATASRRVELTITNWETGRGYMREIADDSSADRDEFGAMLARMGR